MPPLQSLAKVHRVRAHCGYNITCFHRDLIDYRTDTVVRSNSVDCSHRRGLGARRIARRR